MTALNSSSPFPQFCSSEVTEPGASHPLVSFIIPVFNDHANIARCVLSIRRLCLARGTYELVVLDNGSTDETHQVLQDLGVHFNVIEKVHVSVLRNRGARLAQGDFLAFVDSDVELLPEWFHSGFAVFDDSEVVATGCFPEVPPEATWVQQAWDLHQRGQQVKYPVPIAWLPSMNLIVRRDAFWAIGGFSEKLETAEDVDLCYRLSSRGTLLCNPNMKAIHWGEAKDLATFWRKEVWRGIGNFMGLFSHGFRWDELPSLGYPVYILGVFLVLVVGPVWEFWYKQLFVSYLCFVMLILPALLLSLKTGWRTRQASAVPALFLLYFTYGFARAYSMVKGIVFSHKKEVTR